MYFLFQPLDSLADMAVNNDPFLFFLPTNKSGADKNTGCVTYSLWLTFVLTWYALHGSIKCLILLHVALKKAR